MATSFEDLVDRIYETAVEPELWPSVLTDIGRSTDAQGGILLVRRNDDLQWLGLRTTPRLIDRVEEYPHSDAAKRTVTTQRLLALNRPGFVSNQELLTDEEYAVDPMLTEWVLPNGLYNGAATAIQTPTGDLAVLQFMRRVGHPAFDREDLRRLDVFRPHLSRACLLAARWRLERFRSAVEALALIGLPALVLGRGGRVNVANDLAEALTDHVVWRSNDRVSFADPAAASLLERALASIHHPAALSVRSFPVKGRQLTAPVVAHVVPTAVSPRGRDLFGGGLGLLVLTPLKSPESLSTALIQGLFDLTPAEARVASGIVEGLTIDEMAVRHGVSRETVRTQMKAVLAKIGVNRQVEAAAALAALPRVSPAH